MSDRTFHIQLARHAFRGVHGVEPAFVPAQSVANDTAWEQPDMTADAGQRGRLFQGLELVYQALAVHHIIAIHADNDGGPAVVQAEIKGRNQTASFCGKYPETLIISDHTLDNFKAVVVGAIVNDHAFEALFLLAKNAANTERQGGTCVTNWQQNGCSQVAYGRQGRQGRDLFPYNKASGDPRLPRGRGTTPRKQLGRTFPCTRCAPTADQPCWDIAGCASVVGLAVKGIAGINSLT
jgi:hypothetical protein